MLLNETKDTHEVVFFKQKKSNLLRKQLHVANWTVPSGIATIDNCFAFFCDLLIAETRLIQFALVLHCTRRFHKCSYCLNETVEQEQKNQARRDAVLSCSFSLFDVFFLHLWF